ncbi:DUF6069 family protein [Jongsikchunia kroppenstedtii]|uniref:DUF6069 family protein n=1 Tax=Jongsikchunia kroppenstedtii TaxID=1121721 RepID=UPI000362B94C|nr:DUF6069 family protein [Jongsikchunia kroppenstedtii]
MHPDDPNRPRTRRYQPGDYDYPQQAYSQQYPQQQPYQPADYREPYAQQYQQPEYQQPAPPPARAPRPARRSNRPMVNPGVFVGGVLASAVVTAIAAWLAAWVIRAIVDRVNEAGKFGVWNPMANDEYWFAVAGFACALAAGALWYVLQLATPAPDQFFSWIVGLLIVASILLPLLLSREWEVGLTTAVMHLVIGLPILFLIRNMGSRSLEYR